MEAVRLPLGRVGCEELLYVSKKLSKKLTVTEECLRSAEGKIASLLEEVRDLGHTRARLEAALEEGAARERALAAQLAGMEAKLCERGSTITGLRTELDAHCAEAEAYEARLSSVAAVDAKMQSIQQELRGFQVQMLDAEKRENYDSREIAKLAQLAQDEEAMTSLLKRELSRERLRVKELTENVVMAEEFVRRQIQQRDALGADMERMKSLCSDYQAQLDNATAELSHRDRLASLEGAEHDALREGLESLLQRLEASMSPQRGPPCTPSKDGGAAAGGGPLRTSPLPALVSAITSYVQLLMLERRIGVA